MCRTIASLSLLFMSFLLELNQQTNGSTRAANCQKILLLLRSAHMLMMNFSGADDKKNLTLRIKGYSVLPVFFFVCLFAFILC